MPASRTAMIPTTSRILADDSDCGGCNTGQCIEPTINDPSTNIDSSTTLSQPSCDCKGTGFIGAHCEVTCAMECQNGGKCLPAEEPTSRGGRESCSCSKAIVDGNPFAGLTCEYGATKSCMMLGSDSKHSFCTNGGGCQDIIGDNEQHKDCICEAGFEGPHCEYVVGMAPEKIVAGASAVENGTYHPQENSTSDMVFFALIAVVVALIGVLLLAFGVRARKRRSDAKRREKEVREATEELSMIPTHNEPENDIL
eukprot:CAMPEP_0201868008 /NCGR_PEP_ID=MMETSP0902-20130614/2066_1 /ASSEMBLY_ACC=CAM_ASM_000551 /TAXON_ID=420261 /ORGANISM="Thalassiosira antarctica, Strain CCMP982" /LENGTH=253 /DNA_ID=CAMNT_0048393291 /DNA_START=87 /DNA_END=848 /DNA_ORIENTATION=+